jgi:hypothetical protein
MNFLREVVIFVGVGIAVGFVGSVCVVGVGVVGFVQVGIGVVDGIGVVGVGVVGVHGRGSCESNSRTGKQKVN